MTVEAIVSTSEDVHIDETRVNIGEFNTVGALIEQSDERFSAEFSWSQIVYRNDPWRQNHCVDGFLFDHDRRYAFDQPSSQRAV